MFGHFTYIVLTLIFTVPLTIFLWWRHFTMLWQAKGFVALVTALATLYGFFVWPYGLAWKCWAYSEDRILGPRVLGTVLDDLVWWVCITLITASFVVVSTKFERDGKPLIKSILDLMSSL
jgi:hypothetical protein